MSTQLALTRALLQDGLEQGITAETALFSETLAETSLAFTSEESALTFWGELLPVVAKSCFSVTPLDSEGRFWKDQIMDLIGRESFGAFGVFRNTADSNKVAFSRQLLLMYKKWRHEAPEEKIDEARQAYLAVEDELLPPRLDWDGVSRSGPLGGTSDPCSSTLGHDPLSQRHQVGLRTSFPKAGLPRLWSDIFDHVTAQIAWCVDVHDVSDVWTCRHGPGAVRDTRGDKYLFPEWPARLDAVFPYSVVGNPSFTAWVDRVRSETLKDEGSRQCDYGVEEETPSRLTLVPKDVKSWRTITVTPTALQFAQQGVAYHLQRRIENTILSQFINLRDQEPSRVLASSGSLDGSVATVDLSEASDRLSLRLVECIFRTAPGLLQALGACRSRLVEVGDVTIKLKKFGPMGDATTFPVQTLVFLALALTAVLVKRGWNPHRQGYLTEVKKAASQIQIFGDDIIIPTDSYPILVRLLEATQLKVNHAKSFWSSSFREACGLDAWQGFDVTPAYVKGLRTNSRTAGETISMVELSNLLHRKGWWRAAACVTDWLPTDKLAVCGPNSGSFSLMSFSGVYRSHLRYRWGHKLQRKEYRALVPIARSNGITTKGWARLHRFFISGKRAGDALDYLDASASPDHVLRSSPNLRLKWIAHIE